MSATVGRGATLARLGGILCLAVALILVAAGPARGDPEAIDLWVSEIAYEPLVPEFEGYDYVIPTPVLITTVVRKDGPAPVAGAVVAFQHNGAVISTATLADLPVQDFPLTLEILAGDTFEAFVDPGHIVSEWSEINNGLGHDFGFGGGNPCSPYPHEIVVDDPDGSGTLTLTCRSLLRNQRTGKFPYALLILPPYELLEAEGDGTMKTELKVSEFTGEENETSAGVSAALAIETEIGLNEDSQVTIGAEIETGIENTVGHSVRRTEAETFSAVTTANQGPVSGDHTVVITQTRYDVCRYEVTAGSEDGEFITIAIPDDDPAEPNPELTAYDLSDYAAVKDPDAIGLAAVHTIGDSDSYPTGTHSACHVDETDWTGTYQNLCRLNQTVATSAADWECSISESDYASTTQYVKFNMYAKGEFGPVNVQTSFGSMAGWSHRIYEGTEAVYHWVIGPVGDVDDEYRVGGFARNLTVERDSPDRTDGLLLLCYYIVESGGGGAWDPWNHAGAWLGDWTATIAFNPDPDPGSILDDFTAVLDQPLAHDVSGYYAHLRQITDEEIAWGLQFDAETLPEVTTFLDRLYQTHDDLDWILANAPDDPAYRDHAEGMLDNANLLARRIFDPHQSSLRNAPPRAGEPARIAYHPARGALPPGPPVYLRVGYDGWQGIHDEPMVYDSAAGMWEIDTPVPPDAEWIDYVFTNLYDVDDRAGLGWHAAVSDTLRTHDNGSVAVSLTSLGPLGFLDDSHAAGEGLCYPAGGTNWLFMGGLWAGAGGYVANRDYVAEPDPEWTIARRAPGGIHLWEAAGVQLSQAALTDSAASAPRGLVVYQGGASRPAGPDGDFVLITYLVRNEGDAPLPGLYVGQFADFDLDAAGASANWGATDAGLQLAYMYRDETMPYVGVGLLPPDEAANLTLIHNPTFVYPLAHIPDADKALFLSGGDPAHAVPEATEAADWSLLVSAGPYDLEPGQEVAVTFSLVAGDDLVDLKANALRARQWALGAAPTAVAEPGTEPAAAAPVLWQNVPNPFNPATIIDFELPRAGAARLRIFDVAGRLVRTLASGELPAGRHRVRWDGRDGAGKYVASGIYFFRLEAGGHDVTRRMVLVR
ncbi:MAG: T9SS type A sorting domain-containing protein [Candidatus Krumholzibacteriota bacterium]|nr:T9SS type A sorting domain-containing protein [Candidatus Krumholzibacteriota bacterium]